MSDNVAVTAGTGTTIAADEVSDGTLGTVKVQYVKLMDGTLDGTSKATVGSNGLAVDPSGVTSPVSASSLPLPTGASTSSKQDTGNTSLSSIDGKITAVNTGAVVVSSSALPSGASTAAKQPALGTAGTPSSDVITIQGKSSMTPVLTDASATTQPVSGTFWQTTQPISGTVTANAGTNLNTSTLALETGGNLAAIKTDVDKIPSQGQALAAASMPVVLPSAQITTLTPPAAITNYANETGGNLAAAKTDLDTLAGAVTSSKVQVNVTNASIPVTGTFFQSTQPVSLATNTPTLQSGSTTAVTQATASSLNATVVGTGTFAVQAGSSSATGSSVPANAFYKGLLAKTANPSAASDGNLTGALSDKLGKQVVVGSIRDLKGNQFTTITASTSETTVVTAVASTFLDVYGVIIENTSVTASKVTFKDSTAGTTQFEIYVPAGDTRGFMLPESAAFKQTTVNNNWTATCGTSVSSIVISVLYVKNI